MQIKPFLLASASTLALLAAPVVARGSCLMPATSGAYTNATVICGIVTNGDLDLTNSATGMIGGGGVRDTGSTDTTTIDNAGTIYGTPAIDLQGALTLTNRTGGAILGTSGTAIRLGSSGVSTILNDGRIDGDFVGIYASGHLDLTNSVTGEISGGSFGIRDTSSSDSTTIDNSGGIVGGTGLFLQGALKLTNRVGGSINATSGTAIQLNSFGGSSTIVNDGTIEGSYSGIWGRNLTLTNSGTILGDTYIGILAFNDLTATNTGTISGKYAALSTGGNLTLDNSGEIRLLAGDATSIAVASMGITNTITNSGIIDGNVGYGISVDDTSAGSSLSLANSGAITGMYGVYSQVAATTVDNSGTITADTAGIYAKSASADASLALTNSGTITGGTFGVYSQVATTTIDNSGTIGGSSVFGIYTYDLAANTSVALTNRGTITGLYGVLSQAAKTTIDNSGAIGGTGIFGVYAGNSAAASSLALTNRGTITGMDGVSSQVTKTTIDNSGTIAGTRYGVYANDALTLTNTGLISGGAAAVLLHGNGNSVGLDKGARFDGAIDYAGTSGNTTRFGHGSWILDVANYDAADNTIVTAGSAYVVKPDQIIVADGSAVQAGARSALDITRSLSGLASDALSQSSASLPVAGSSGGALAYADDDAVDRRFASAALPGSGQENAFSHFSNGAIGDAAGNIVWSRVLVGRSTVSQDAANASSWMNFVGVAFGGDHRVSDTLRLGGFFGLADSRTETDGDASLKSKWYYAGLYGGWSPGAAFVEGNLTGGYAANRSERLITNGLATETASGDYGSTFFSPELAVGYHVALRPGVSLTPQLRVRYLGVDAEGYSETGSSADMTVSRHYTGFLEERALAKLQFDNARWSLFTTVGVVGLHRIQGSGTNVSLLGIDSTVAGGDANLFGATFGLGGDWKMTDTVSLHGAINGTAFNNNASIDTNVGLKMVF
ncbi:MAG: autotransporter domain-containing protein [Mesorhizobium sp.]|uniref:autotransporter outer membrane beta-barrel domain-containing protein n=1 Tax=Mesorhizobium sp. TaxID=1871066 RepID=UPI001AD461D9|nr:autotransporter domain-containing protein [Mesorhizobium sp.]MBN9221277.1 autotransporter domain-containing protein [Mesorhizobium sp.]